MDFNPTYTCITACFVNSVFKENLALRKPVWEDQEWKDPYIGWRGGNAVDGLNTDRSANGGQCVITENKAQTATWRVDLGGVVSISHIDIYYRTGNKGSSSVYCMERNIV